MTPAEIFIEIEAWEKKRERQDYRVGLLCASFLEPYRDREAHPEPFSPFEFMTSNQEHSVKTQTPEEQLEIIKVINAAMGGNFVVS